VGTVCQLDSSKEKSIRYRQRFRRFSQGVSPFSKHIFILIRMGLGISTGCTQTIPDDTNRNLEEAGLKETFRDWTVRDVNEALIETEGFTNGEMKCGWREFFRVCQDIKDRKDRAKVLRERDSMHPACLSYAMVSESPEEIEETASERASKRTWVSGSILFRNSTATLSSNLRSTVQRCTSFIS